MPDTSTAAALEALVAEVQAMRVELAELRRPPPRRALAPADRDWLMRLLPEIDTATDRAVWALPELAALALLPDNAALASALAARTGRGGGLRALGKALARCAGHAVDGYELRQVGSCRDGALWQVTRV